ncbi:hypothetical protein C2845_PM07G06020 [Panicum miliaceum]|uniref:Uncharacterized protein n=1 Tax=Panicum miliaceum TaxID=4540 RepID=A0A3L6SS10_PANMI|nr:hypothetical protein C2845_PM07G06020 [Panicum miliaceum]
MQRPPPNFWDAHFLHGSSNSGGGGAGGSRSSGRHGGRAHGTTGEEEDGRQPRAGSFSDECAQTKKGPASPDKKGVEEWAPFGVAVPDYRFRENCEGQVVDPMQEEAALTVWKAPPDSGAMDQSVQAEHAEAQMSGEPELLAVNGDGGFLAAIGPTGNAVVGEPVAKEAGLAFGPADGADGGPEATEAVNGIVDGALAAKEVDVGLLETGAKLAFADGPPAVLIDGPHVVAGSLDALSEKKGGFSAGSGVGLAAKEVDLVHVEIPDGPSDGGLCKEVPVGVGGVSETSSQKQPLYTKKIHGALLCTPAKLVTTKSTGKKGGTPLQASRKSTRLANRPASDLTMKEQATALLIKKSSFLDCKQMASPNCAEVFCSKFADPMPDDTVGGYREVFGIDMVSGADSLSVVAVHADA